MRPDEFFEQRWRAERDELWARVGAGQVVKQESHSPSVVILEVGQTFELGSADLAAARRVENAALGAGWSVRVVRSLAAEPRRGLLTVLTVRARRHDERLWAAWWNGHFECAQYLVRGSAIERLGFRTTKIRRSVMDAIEGMRLEST